MLVFIRRLSRDSRMKEVSEHVDGDGVELETTERPGKDGCNGRSSSERPSHSEPAACLTLQGHEEKIAFMYTPGT